MPRIIVTNMSPGELFRHSHRRATIASREIQRLKDAPLAPAETLQDRTLLVATLAHELSEAFEIMETLFEALDEGAIVPDEVSPPSSTESPAPGHRGVHQEPEDPNTN